jgi:hypothetical protein
MTEAELTLEERNRLWTQCGIAFLVVFFSFLAWLLHFKVITSPPIGWDIFIWVGLPYGIVGPMSFFLTYEVFYPRRIRKSRMFHVKRFARRALGGSAVILSFSAVMSMSQITFSKTLEDNAIFPGITLYLLVAVAAVFIWLRHQNSRTQQDNKTL